jgi:hypothetical protein
MFPFEPLLHHNKWLMISEIKFGSLLDSIPKDSPGERHFLATGTYSGNTLYRSDDRPLRSGIPRYQNRKTPSSEGQDERSDILPQPNHRATAQAGMSLSYCNTRAWLTCRRSFHLPISQKAMSGAWQSTTTSPQRTGQRVWAFAS